jgi:hypothetical protein
LLCPVPPFLALLSRPAPPCPLPCNFYLNINLFSHATPLCARGGPRAL